MRVSITLGRSDALLEFWGAPDNTPEVVALGPFEYVELTYDHLRVGPEGEHIGHRDPGGNGWFLNDDPVPFSDIDVYAGEPRP